MDIRSEAVLIASILEDIGYRPEIGEDHRIRVTSAGIAATIMLYGDASLSLRCRVEGGDEATFELAGVNKANHDMRFAKFSVDGNSLLLECDFVFNPHEPAARDRLTQIMTIWDTSLGSLRALVAESLQPA